MSGPKAASSAATVAAGWRMLMRATRAAGLGCALDGGTASSSATRSVGRVPQARRARSLTRILSVAHARGS